MPTTVYINFFRPPRVPEAPIVKKIQLIKDRHIQVKRLIDGVDVVTSYDFTHSELGEESQDSPNSYADTLYRYMIDAEGLHVWIAGSVAEGTELPKPNYQVTTHSGKTTIWKASGEDNTIEPVSGVQPDWIPGALLDADFIAQMKPRVTGCAKNFDEGFRWHWLHHGTLGRDIFADPPESDDMKNRFLNTSWWGRTWVGYAWRQLTNTGQGVGKNRITHEKMRTLIGQLELELPNPKQVFTWHKSHDIADWSKLYSRTGKIGYKLHTTDLSSYLSDTRIVNLNHVDWEEILKTHYNAALHA